MVGAVRAAALGEQPHDGLEGQLQTIAQASHVDAAQIRTSLIQGWTRAVDHFLEDGALDESEETRLIDFASSLDLKQDELDAIGGFTRVVKGAILRDVMGGIVPDRCTVTGSLPFNFQKTEQLVWLFPSVAYYEHRTRRAYVGGHHGVSVRIAKGTYYRVGAFRGHPVETTEVVALGSGALAVTTKHLYFAGEGRSFRIRHDRIVTIEPFEDGVGIQRDAQTAKPQVFKTGDGWFTYNLLINIANL